MNDRVSFARVFAQIADGTLSPDTVRNVFDAILDGAWTPIQVGAFIAALRLHGETADTIAAAASAMRAAMVTVAHTYDRVLDTCGTGGDGRGTLNLSTGAAIIAAAADIPVAKHGNRAVSSRAGSADVLEALGVPTDLTPGQATSVFASARITFLLAPKHHPAMRHAAQARQELGMRTIFNCLGPLANPARATHQLVGAYTDGLRTVLANTLLSLGTRRAWVVHSEDGLDEVSPFAPTRVAEVVDGRVTDRVISPKDFGLDPSPAGAIDGGDAKQNARILEGVLNRDKHPSRDAFILNTAAALVVALDLAPLEATERARRAIDDGTALETLNRWRRSAQEAKSTDTSP